MRTSLHVVAVAGVLALLLMLLQSHKNNSATLSSSENLSYSEGSWPSEEDKIVVVPKVTGEDTDWLSPDLPDWQNAIYNMDDSSADFHVPENKGKEAMAYLTYLIDHYSDLPSTIAFIHSHRDSYPKAWHTDAEGHNIVNSLKNLQIQYVQEQGYVNLRCIPDPGCPAEIQPFREPYEEHRSAEHEFSAAWRYMFGNETEIPQRVGAACCGQFAVSRTQVLQRPQDDYRRYRDWILQTKLDSAVSGRVMEYLWHIIFGKEAVFCPDLLECYCHVFGWCEMRTIS